MDHEDLKLLTDWLEENKDHKLNFLEKEAIKLAVKRANTVGHIAASTVPQKNCFSGVSISILNSLI